jgi:hypothetical protein
MAKDKNEKKVGIVDVNEDNFEEHVNSVGKFTEEEIALANENEAKEIKERKARDFNHAKYKTSYQKMRIVADCVYSKKAMEAQKKAMKAIDAEFEKIKKGEIDLVDFEAARDKAIDDAIKEVKELGNTRRTNIRKLQEQYPNHWSYSWDDPFQRLNRAIEDNKR